MGREVLVVDDDRHFASQMVDLLDMHGWTARSVRDGASAIAEYQRARPDAVLLDLVLPQTTGGRVLAQLRALPGGESLPVLITSAAGRPDGPLAQEAMKLGAVAFLAKPFQHDALLSILQRVAGSSSRIVAVPKPETPGRAAESDAWSGTLRPSTIVRLLATIFHGHQHGILSTDGERGPREIYVLNGYPIWTESQGKDRPLAQWLCLDGSLTTDALAGIEEDVGRGIAVRHSVVERGLLTAAELSQRLAAWVTFEVEALLGQHGRYRWEEGDSFVGRVPIHEVNPVQACWNGVRSHLDLRVALRDLETIGTRRLARTRTFARLFGYMADSPTLRRLGEKLVVGGTVPQLRDPAIGAEDEVLRALWLMVQTGMISIQESTERPERETGSHRSVPGTRTPPPLQRVATEVAVQLDVGRRTSERIPAIPNDVDLETLIARDHVARMELDHYAFLGISRAATSAEVDTAYQQLAPRYRLRSGGDGLAPDTKKRARELLTRLMQAVEVLSDTGRRAAYDAAGAPPVGLTAGPAPSTARMTAVTFAGQRAIAGQEPGPIPSTKPTTSAVAAIVIVADLTLDPIDVSGWPEIGERWVRAREALAGGDARKACAMYDALRALAPAEPGVLADFGWARWVAGPPDDRTGEKALEWLALAQTFDPQHRQAVEAEVRIRQALIQGEELRRAVKRLLRLKPDLAWAKELESEIDSATQAVESRQGSALGRLFGRRG